MLALRLDQNIFIVILFVDVIVLSCFFIAGIYKEQCASQIGGL